MQIINRHINMGRKVLIAFAAVVISGFLGACASQASNPNSQSEEAEAAQESTKTDISKASPNNSDTSLSNQESKAPSEKEETFSAIKIVEECKNETYVKLEQQSRTSLQKGWEATKAQKFGVGFRDEDEYKKWSKTHNEVFTSVSDACLKLSKCAKANQADKQEKCVVQAKHYSAWQELADNFTKNAKMVESTQPPPLCSVSPSVHDSAQCYNKLADNIDAACQTENCKEASTCFRGVYHLDGAMRQAESSCGFVGQALENCRGYIAASSRRESEFKLCMDLYNGLDADITPTL